MWKTCVFSLGLMSSLVYAAGEIEQSLLPTVASCAALLWAKKYSSKTYLMQSPSDLNGGVFLYPILL